MISSLLYYSSGPVLYDGDGDDDDDGNDNEVKHPIISHTFPHQKMVFRIAMCLSLRAVFV